MTKAKKTKKNTLVTFLLDKSGSMESIRDTTIGSFNEYINTLKLGKAPIEFSLIQFDNQAIEKTWLNAQVKSVEGLSRANFVPRGMTPLIDAAYKTIKAIEKALMEREDNPNVVVCIQTDGEENCSSEFTWEQLNALIKAKTELGWKFSFMGAGIDAYKQATTMGIHTANTMSYSNDYAATSAAFGAMACNTVGYASGALRGTAYNSMQKSKAGDKFDPDLKVKS